MQISSAGASVRARLLLGVIAPVLTLVLSPARAQTGQSGDFRLTAISFSGLNKFTEKQATAATGLRIGDSIAIAQLSVAANELAKSGVFEKVAFQYSTRGNELSAIFTVVESKRLSPCVFDNFVWFLDDQLDKALRARVPLYSGVTAETGETEQQIIDALRALLQSNGVNGDVQVIPFGGSGSPMKVVMFRVVGVPMPIKTVNFPGASAVTEKELEAAAARIIGQDFSITNVTEFEPVALLPLYHRKGYLRAAFLRPQWALIGSPSAGSPPDIAVTVPVKEGAQYFWDKTDWAGNHQLSTDQLEQTLSMKHGEIANQQKIDEGLQTIRRSYDKLGYIDASVQPRANLDDSKLLAAYVVSINEGVQYRMGKLQFAGITEKAANDLLAKWQMKAGAVFDGSYPSDFVDNIAIRRLYEMGIKKTKANFGFRRDPQNAVVDVQVVFQ